ncbi:urease isoform X1 [Tanacetum coccineum]
MSGGGVRREKWGPLVAESEESGGWEEEVWWCVGGERAQKRLARGSRLNYTKAVALIATQILEFVHDGDKSVAELMDIGRQLLERRQILPTVPHLLDSAQVEGTFPDVPSLEKFPIIEGDKIPGEPNGT